MVLNLKSYSEILNIVDWEYGNSLQSLWNSGAIAKSSITFYIWHLNDM